MQKDAKIYIPGHTGLVGARIVELLKEQGFSNLLVRSRTELELMNSKAVSNFFSSEKPEYVINCAAKVGGIKANVDYPAEFLYENTIIQNNIMWAAKELGVKKFLYISSAVVYPNECPQPIKEEYFMTGEPDPTKSGYAYSKIIGTKLAQYIYEEFDQCFIACMPTNLYGINDNFDPATSHVIPALIRRMHEAKVNNTPEVVIWGSGKARREFLYIDDFCNALIWMMNNYTDKQFLNIGTGEDISMQELATIIQKLVGYKGKLVFDATKPEGMMRRVFDVSRVNEAGWKHSTTFEEGLAKTYDWYLKEIATSQ